MRSWNRPFILFAWLPFLLLLTTGTRGVLAQDPPERILPPVQKALPVQPVPTIVRITLQEAKERALANNKLLNMGHLNAEGKAFAIKAAKADYFPKISGSAIYLRFNEDLGSVLSTQGRTVTGPRDRPLITFPANSVNLPIMNQNTSFATIGAVQPITDLLKVRQGVKIAQADEQIALAQLHKGMRDVASGVEQLYWGLLAARRLQAGALESLKGAELLAKTQILEARTALVEARQALQQIEKQVADVQEQLNGLLDLPLCTTLELVEPPMPVLSYRCADEVIDLALSISPEVREAHHTILKAQAATAAGKLDYVPSIAVIGGYLNQTGASYVQENITYAGVVGTYTFVDWGKRKNVVRERQTLIGMATMKLRQTEDEIRQKVQKAFRELADSQIDLKNATEMVQLRKEAEKNATTPEALKNPRVLLIASKDRMLAEVDLVKADLSYRQAYVQIMTLVGGCQ